MEARPDAGPAIEAFWEWWGANRDLVEREVDSAGAAATFIEPLSARIAAISPVLDWEFGRGRRARHHLSISAKGDPRLRVIAERWRARGPGDDDVFEFYCARQRNPAPPDDSVLGFGERQFAFADLRFDVDLDESRQRFELTVHHPDFSTVPEELRGTLMFIALDNILGEDAVETWIGALEPTPEPAPEDAIGPATLRRLVDGAEERWPEPHWALFEGRVPDTDRSVILKACASHKYLLDPLFDTLALVRIPYPGDDAGMPDPETWTRLEAMGAELDHRLGAEVRVLAQQTGNDLRLMWVYLRSENGPERRTLGELLEPFPGAGLTVTWDPGWRQLPV